MGIMCGARWSHALFLACVASAASVQVDDNNKTVAATTTTTTTVPPADHRRDVSILKQINKVNDDGSYTFGYEASDGSFKVETRDVAGNVKGMFGFVDEAGRLKRVSYSASNSSGFQTAAAGSTTESAVNTSSYRKNADDPAVVEPGKSTAAGVKKVLVSKRPVLPPSDETGRLGNYLRRQLSGNGEVDNDSADVYAGTAGPMSPVVSALMSELNPVRASYTTRPLARSRPVTYDEERQYDGFQHDSIDRRTEEDDETPPQYRPIAVQRYRERPALHHHRHSYQHQQQQPAAYPTLLQPPPPPRPVVYGPDLTSLRDELMELVLYFVQARVSQITSYPNYQQSAELPRTPYPVMPYQQPNYYVPSYYQGPRIPGPSAGFVVRQHQDGYAAAPQQSSSPRVTQTLKDGLIRMLLSTSPRYDQERIAGEPSTVSLTYRPSTTTTTTTTGSTTQTSAPVRNVQIIGEDNDDRAADTRPVAVTTTTETPD